MHNYIRRESEVPDGRFQQQTLYALHVLFYALVQLLLQTVAQKGLRLLLAAARHLGPCWQSFNLHQTTFASALLCCYFGNIKISDKYGTFSEKFGTYYLTQAKNKMLKVCQLSSLRNRQSQQLSTIGGKSTLSNRYGKGNRNE